LLQTVALHKLLLLLLALLLLEQPVAARNHNS
jgi:hypothetical protein